MENIDTIELIKWCFGICVTGFFFLAGCVWWLARQLPAAKSIAMDLHEIKNALLGTMEKPGFITKLYNVAKEVEDLKILLNSKR